MTDSLKILKSAFLDLYPELSTEEWAFIKENCHPKTISIKESIINEGEIQKNLFFQIKGLTRGFYINEKGEEITMQFVSDKEWVTSYTALITSTPSKYIYQALQHCEIIVLPYLKVIEGYEKFKGLQKFGRLIAEKVLRLQQKRIEGFQFLTPEERYLAFIENYPDLFAQVSVSHLCSYIGITRQSLTRIRKRLIDG